VNFLNRFNLLASLLVCGLIVMFSPAASAHIDKHHHKHAAIVHVHRQKAAPARHAILSKQSLHKKERTAALRAHLKHAAAAAQHQPKHIRGHRVVIARHQPAAVKLTHLQRLRAQQEHHQIVVLEANLAHLRRVEATFRKHIAAVRPQLSPKSIDMTQVYVDNVAIREITVDLNDPTVKVTGLMARNGVGTAEPFSRMIRRTQPDVAVTGTFFGCDNLKPVGDIVIDGHLIYFGGMGTALCITPDNHAEMIRVARYKHTDWSDYNFVMACGPRLLQDHHYVLDPASERFNQASMLAPNSRIGVGITDNNKLIFVMTRQAIVLSRLAKIMSKLGCSQAMNLDGGESVGFYCEGDMIARPGRWLTNAIVVYAKQRPTLQAAI